MRWIWTLLIVYSVGFVMLFALHVVYLQMVTVQLAFVRSLVWPVYLATGWPHGTPMPMD